MSTLLPYTVDDEQQIERKRHIFNDVVTVIFKEGNTPINPALLKSHFTHAVIVVQIVEPKATDINPPKYRISVCYNVGVSSFGPPLPQPAVFYHDKYFREFLLTKCTK